MGGKQIKKPLPSSRNIDTKIQLVDVMCHTMSFGSCHNWLWVQCLYVERHGKRSTITARFGDWAWNDHETGDCGVSA
jgi:hypothetical protein